MPDTPSTALYHRLLYGTAEGAPSATLTHAYEDGKGEWQAQAVADIGDPSKVPLPVDKTISADDRLLWVNTFMDGTTPARATR